MNFWMYFYGLLAFFTSQALAFNLRFKLPSAAMYNPDYMELEKGSLNLQERKTVKEASFTPEINQKTASLNARKPSSSIPDSTWRPSKVDYSDAFNDILIPNSEYLNRDVQEPAATFEELENQNANIYNPLLNLDHYPIPSKKYTFAELENMNANQYNPYLD